LWYCLEARSDCEQLVGAMCGESKSQGDCEQWDLYGGEGWPDFSTPPALY